jgi:hypothetical protein
VSGDPQETAKLPTSNVVPMANGSSGHDATPGPGAIPPPPGGAAPQPGAVPQTPQPGTVPPPPATTLPPAPPVGPPRFPLPGRRKGDLAPPKKLSPDEAAKEAEAKEEESAELISQRDRLLEKFTVMQADLGGAFYEMAIRDHVRLDVLTRKAAELQRVDAELLAVERALELERSDAAGLCPGCGAPYGPAVRFCAQCGTPLMPSEAGA